MTAGDVLVGALGAPGAATVSRLGRVAPVGRPFEIEWWIGAEDRWRFPAEEPALRQSRAGGAPVVETRVRVPGGDACARVYGVAGPAALGVVEFENQSPSPFVVCVVVRAEPGARLRDVRRRDRTLDVDRRPALLLPGPPRRWASAPAASGTRALVTTGAASEGDLTRVRAGRGAGVEVALLYPVPHRTRGRVAVVLDAATGARAVDGVDLASLPGAGDVERGWAAHLGRGLRLELPDEHLALAADAARAALLLEAGLERPAAAAVAALEDWGFDAEAAAAWNRLPLAARREATRRPPPSVDAWDRVRAHLAAASPALAFAGGPAAFLRALRDVVVRECVDGAVEILPGFPDGWRGAPVAVHGAPTRAGPVSFALRWHGARPALLWEAPAGVPLRAPRLDPAWSAPGGAGEALLAGG